jgi:hypothetical protein
MDMVLVDFAKTKRLSTEAELQFGHGICFTCISWQR